jgi:cyclohexyl-isocyanide hydratase
VVIDRNRVTGGGVTAGIDFGLALAARVAGEEVARRIALGLEYAPEPPFPGSPTGAATALVETVTKAGRAMWEERKRLCETAVARRKA